MHKLSFTLLSILFLIFTACTNNESSEQDLSSRVENPIAPIEDNAAQENNPNASTLTAKFIDFQLGDAEHYYFEDESGKRWDFSACLADNFDFAMELPEEEADESNQGWGPNPELQGKWFKLTHGKEEQPLYQDGPMGMVEIIEGAVLLEQ